MRVKLTKTDIDKCMTFGRAVVTGYAEGKKNKSKALFVPGRPAIHDDEKAQGYARMAELAFVRAAGFDDNYLNWSKDKCDGSYDVKLHNLTIDVKSSVNPRATRLMWPVSKNHFIENAADILVFIKLHIEETPPTAELAGWIGRHTFLAKAKTSTGEWGIAPGTRYMKMDSLSAMKDLFHMTAIVATAHGKDRVG